MGVLLAAGRGRRAGGTKQLRAWVTASGVQPLVAASFDAVSWACGRMVVVLGHEAERVRGALGGRACEVVVVDPDAPMSESVRLGLRGALAGGDRSGWILLHLGDHPRVECGTLERLVGIARDEEGDGGRCVIPEFSGRGGHPALIRRAAAEAIVADPMPRGLRGFWEDHRDLCRRVPVGDSWVVRDVDRAGPIDA